jgi:hypothetical protein
MAYLPPTTIAATLARIQSGELILPAIQREFVWEPDQVTGLFDSLMRGYPIGGFLSWKVDQATVSQFRFYGFLKDYSAFDSFHCPSLDVPATQSVTAILDGQQRLTSLNIGLRGSYANRLPRGWRNKKASYPKRRLYLNVLGDAPENEAGLLYDFRLIRDDQIQREREDGSRYWFPVSEVYAASGMNDLMQLMPKHGLGNDANAVDRVGKLWEAIHQRTSLHFYEETDQDVERVLDIFIRVNSGGTVLSYSDLLLSIATAQWKERDAREEIHELVDSLNSTGQGFNFSQDVILKAGLVLAGINDFAFRVKNFNATNMALLDKEWDAIGDSLRLGADLLADFGLSEATLPAASVLIPVAYYLHRRGLGQGYRTSVKDAADRAALRKWVLRTLVLPGVWGSGLDTLLRELRSVLDKDGADGFPVAPIEQRMAARGKALVFSDEVIDDLLSLRWGQKRTFAVLAILFPHVDTRNIHHVDHVFPRKLFGKADLKKLGMTEHEVEDLHNKRDQLPNLQLLEGPENIAKSGMDPKSWVVTQYPESGSRHHYLDRNALPPKLPGEPTEFAEFFQSRRSLLIDRVKKILAIEGGDQTATTASTVGDVPDFTEASADVSVEEIAMSGAPVENKAPADPGDIVTLLQRASARATQAESPTVELAHVDEGLVEVLLDDTLTYLRNRPGTLLGDGRVQVAASQAGLLSYWATLLGLGDDERGRYQSLRKQVYDALERRGDIVKPAGQGESIVLAP